MGIILFALAAAMLMAVIITAHVGLLAVAQSLGMIAAPMSALAIGLLVCLAIARIPDESET